MTDLATIGFRADVSGLKLAQRELDNTARHGESAERKIDRSIDNTNKNFLTLKNSIGVVGAAIAALGSAALARDIVRYSDSWKSVTSQLRQVTESEAELARVRQMVLQVSRDTRSELEATTGLYAALDRSTTQLGLNTERQIELTRTINNLFVAGGKSAQEASGAIRQLVQGLEAGALRGDEFNSVAENAPRILDALAASTGMARGQLREFAATGGITAEILVKALESYSETAQNMADQTEQTFGQSMEIAKTNVVEFVGELDGLNSIINGLGGGILGLTENLDGVKNAIGAGAAVLALAATPAIAKYVAGLSASTYAALTATPAVTGLSAALGVQAAKATTATVATNAFTIATRVMLGPIGLALAVFGAAAAAFSLTESEARSATMAFNDHGSAVNQLTSDYDRLTEAQRESARASVNIRITEIEREIFKLEQLRDASSEAANGSGELARLLGISSAEIKKAGDGATKYQAAIDSLRQEMNRLNEALTGNNKKQEEAEKISKKVQDSYDGKIQALDMELLKLRLSSDAYELYSARISALNSGLSPKMIADIEKRVVALQKERNALKAVDAELENLMDGELFKLGDEIDKIKDKTESWADITERSVDRIDASFADVWMNILDGADNVFGSLINSFKRMIAEMAHAAITRPIMLQIGTALGLGGMSGAANAAGMLGGLGGGGILGSLGGGIMGIGNFIGGAFGSGFAGTGALLGAGSLSGALANVGGLFGSGSILGGLGAALPLVGIAAGGLGLINSITGGGLFGTSYKPTGNELQIGIGGGNVSGSTILEESKKKSLFRGTRRRYTETSFDTTVINDMFDAVEMSIIDAANMLDIDTVSKTVSTGFNREFGDRFAMDFFESMYSTVQLPVEDWLKQFSRSMKIDISDMSESDVQQAIQDWAAKTTDEMVRGVFGSFITQIQRDGEGASDALNRVITNMNAVGAVAERLNLGFDLTGKAAALAATNIVDLVGGLDALNTFSTQYYNSFFSEAERFDMLQEQLESSFEGLGLSLVGSRSEFRSLVEGLDLTTDAGQKMFAALMQLVPGLDQYLSYLEAQNSLIDDGVIAFENLQNAAKGAFSALQASVNQEKSLLNANKRVLDDNLAFAKSQLELAFGSEIDAIQRAASARIDALNEERAIAQSNLNLLQQVSSRFMRGATVDEALAAARRGDFSVANSLGNTGISSSGFGGASDFAFAQAVQSAKLSQIGGLAGSAATQAERQIAAIDRQILATQSSADRQVEELQKQLNALLGIDESVPSIEEAIKLYQQAQLDLDELNYNAEIERLDKILADGQAQINALLGIDTSVKSVEMAVHELGLAISAAEQMRQSNESLRQEIAAMREENKQLQMAILDNSMITANTLRSIERDGLDTRVEEA